MDERKVPFEDAQSNWKVCCEELLLPAGLGDQKRHHVITAAQYSSLLKEEFGAKPVIFDEIFLGMGEDGHTASLFPATDALSIKGCYVTPNYIPQKKTWRLTLTFDALNDAANTVFYVTGASKADMLAHVFASKPHLPCQLVGTVDHPALWIVDEVAAQKM